MSTMSNKITGKEYPLSKIFSADFEYHIPGYQRPYAWTEEETGILFDDLYEFFQTEAIDNYFLGSIVLIKDENKPYADVIDGQQRVTTISLLFLAMYHLLQKGVVSSEKKYLAGKIYKDYLVDEYAEGDARIKLKPVKNDREAFYKLFDELILKKIGEICFVQ